MKHKEPENTTCNNLWLHQPSPPAITQPSLLWNQTHAQKVQNTQLFKEIPSLRRKAPQQTFLPRLTSNRLWGYVEQRMMPSLWLTSSASAMYLWPYGEGTIARSYLWPSAPAAKKIEVVTIRSRSLAITRLTRLTRLQSSSLWVATAACKNGGNKVTALWEPAESGVNVVGSQKQEPMLWIKGEHIAPAASRHLWPNAPELPMLPSSLPAIRARVASTELPMLESNQLWTFAKEAIGLWSFPERSTGLWPHGGREKVVSFLWPSASALNYIPAKVASKRSRVMRAELEKLESKQLWSYSDVQFESVEVKGMWKAATVSAKPTIVEQNMETLTSLLWTAPEEAPYVVTPSYLWPLAHPLPSPLPLPRVSPTKKSRNPAKSTIVSLSGGLWSSAPVLLPRLWSAPVTESGLWPHGRLQHAQTRTLWPSARPLASTENQSLHNARIIVTGLKIESSRLWSAESAIKAELWAPPPKQTGLWPNGQVVKSKSVGLWPSDTELRFPAIVSIRQFKQRSPTNLETLESHELWSNFNVKQSLWKKANGQSGLWPQGTHNSGKRQLWSANSNMQTVLRRNLTLKLATIEGRKRYERKAITAILESRALWSRPVHIRPKSAGRLWTKEIEYIGELPKFKTAELQAKDDVASVSPGLWANPSPISSPSPANLMTPVAVLWTASPLKTPRIEFTICRETIAVAAVQRRKSAGAANLMLTPLQGNLWVAGTPSLLPGGSTPRTGMKQAPQDGLWNSARTHAKLEKKVPLWHRYTVIGKDRGAVKQQTLKTDTTGSFVAVKPDQLRTLIAAETEEDGVNHVHHDGLWHPAIMTKPAKERPLTTGVDTVPRERTFVTPRTCALWQKNKSDKPLAPIFPASVMIIPAVPSRSNKRVASNIPPPLFLARVGGPMWTADKTSESRPRGLWRQTKNERMKKGLWQPNNIDKYSTLTVINQATSPEKKSNLWSFSGTKPERQSIFQNLSVESIRRSTSTTTRNHNSITNPMEGSLWVKSRNTTPEKPKLWRKAEIPQRLWAADNNFNSSNTDMTITTKAVPTVATTHLWGKDNVTTTPIFGDLSLESSRSRREFTPKAFSAPPEGLWKMALTSEPLEMTAEVPRISLWGAADAAPIVVKNVPTKTLWQKDNTETPIFADLPLESFRSKKDHSTATLPMFSEGMWKKKVALPERPQLWKPIPKATGLWDANAKTKTLAQISLERKAKGTKKPLWSKERASRTTAKVPQRSPLAIVRISDDLTLPKATGDLWKPKSPVRQAPVLWTAPKPVTQSAKPAKPAKPTATLLWGQGSGSKTTAAVAERTKVPFIPSDAPLAQVSGSLWKPKSTDGPIGLWKRPIKAVAATTVAPSVPLWAARTASRTTSAVPQRLPVLKKKDTRSIILPPATGSLWQPPKRTPEKGLWKAPAPPTRRPRSASLLWASHSAARTTTAIPVRTTVPKRLVEEPLKTVSGTLWKAPSNEPKKGLWKRTIPTVATYRKTSTTSLWSKESASRTTSAKPERAPFVPKVIDEKSLTLSPATGDLWMPSSATPQTVSLWSRPATPSSGSGIWDAQGRTPTLAEIKLALATQRDKTELWQRRSVLTSKPAIVDISKITSSSTAPQKKVKTTEPAPVPQVDGSLWRPCVDGKNEQGIMWITRSSRSSSLESEFISPGVSRASTISDMSDETESPLTTGKADAFEPEVMRIHSTKVSVSSAAGENMWRPIEAAEGKGKGVSRSDQKEQELPTWGASHSLWSKPSTDEEKVRNPPL